ncbi:MAG: hypothetical protein IPI19_02190 [Ignavibacteriales bacterium]|nr:hypothetical protein [Ignavibacteriales bacterium]
MKPKYFLFLCFSFLIFNSSLLIGTVRYVSKTGTNTPPYTSWQTAADSIQKCINICVNGDTVYVANGVYKENLVINTAISLIGSSMDSTVIELPGIYPNNIIISNGVLHLHIFSYGGYPTFTSNIVIDEGGTRKGVDAYTSGLAIENNLIINYQNEGIALYSMPGDTQNAVNNLVSNIQGVSSFTGGITKYWIKLSMKTYKDVC